MLKIAFPKCFNLNNRENINDFKRKNGFIASKEYPNAQMTYSGKLRFKQ